MRFSPYIVYNSFYSVNNFNPSGIRVNCFEGSFGVKFSKNFSMEVRIINKSLGCNSFLPIQFDKKLLSFFFYKKFSLLITSFFFITFTPIDFFSFKFNNKWNYELFFLKLENFLLPTYYNFHLGFGINYILSTNLDIRIAYLKRENISVVMVGIVYFF